MSFDNLTNKIKPELLAPAGNIQSFYAVLNAGADAVYMAGNRFGARAFADNFSDEELISCIRYAHLYNKKIYLTVNTLIRNDEKDELLSFLKPLYKAGLDGVIVQDLGVFSILHSTFPNLALHASTQLSVTGKGAASLLKEMGVSRIVPARELSLDEVLEIKSTGVSVECFIHGAMCYCYSGSCLFSSVLGGRSGNRGMCAQPCRLPYSLGEKKECYPLSLKDMCTIDILEELIKAGIDSFKIEGRMKKPEYAAGVTAIYRKYIDLFFEKGSITVEQKDRKTLNDLYIRSKVLDGYYHRYNGPEMVTIVSPSYNGADDETLKDIREKYIGEGNTKKLPRIPIRFSAFFITGEKASISVFNDEHRVEVTGDIVQAAKRHPITEEDILKSFKKLGNTIFSITDGTDDTEINLSPDAYYSLKELNELRRRAVEALENEILLSFGYFENDIQDTSSDNLNENKKAAFLNKDYGEANDSAQHDKATDNKLNIYVTSTEQLKALGSFDDIIGRIYVTEKMLVCDKDVFGSVDKDIPVFAALPYIRRSNSLYYRNYIVGCLEESTINGILVRNLEDLDYFSRIKKAGIDFDIISDSSLYAWNDESVLVLSKKCDEIGLPLELSGGTHINLCRNNPDIRFEKMIFGRYPLMQSANCIFKTDMRCQKKNKEKCNFTYLKDRTGASIPVLADCLHCHNTIYNPVPLSVFKLDDKKESNMSLRLDLTDENANKVYEVMDFYRSLLKGEEVSKPDWTYTNGFEKKSTQ